MAKSSGKITGSDAAYIKPKLIPDFELLPRDDSGGIDYDSYTQEFGDGGFVQGEEEKGHLSATGGGEHEELNDEESERARSRDRGSKPPASSRAMSRK